MRTPEPDPLDHLAGVLREQLVSEAGEASAGARLEPGPRIAALVDREAGVLDPATRAELARRIAERSFGMGPLEPLLADPAVDEIMVNGTGRVWVERGGRIEATGVAFDDEAELRHAIERILAPLGRRVDEAEPLCDARLPDGSRVNVVLPPLAVDGPTLTIRRFRPRGFTAADLVARETWTQPLHDVLQAAVAARCNVLVSGGTGSGKTTTLNALSSFVGAQERIVTIEDTAELRLQQPHVVRLEARPASIEGRGEVTIRRLVRNALRMRPDRIVVGEVRGPEALHTGLHSEMGADVRVRRAFRPGAQSDLFLHLLHLREIWANPGAAPQADLMGRARGPRPESGFDGALGRRRGSAQRTSVTDFVEASFRARTRSPPAAPGASRRADALPGSAEPS